jgi:uncharacterized membrane protein
MWYGFCHIGNWSSVESFGAWVWVGLFAGLTLLVVWVLQRARAFTAAVPSTARQPTAKDILQTRYARGEITREQYQQTLNDVR